MSLLKSTGGGAGEYLFLNDDMSDITIIVKSFTPPWRFPAHSLMLSAQSIVFRRMLGSDFSERKNQEIVIEDISPMTVERLLRFMYCGQVNIDNWKEGIDLLKAAHKYQVELLVQKCGKYLESVVTLLNVCYLFNEASVFSLMTLKEKCLQMILDVGFVVLRSKAFEMLGKESVMEVVSECRLNVDSELTVFDALLRWALMQCCRNGKEVTESSILSELQPFLQYICFDDMSDTDKGALPTSILSCMKPNNRTRMHFCVMDSLLLHSSQLNFSVDQLSTTSLSVRNFMRFSLDSSAYLIGFTFVMLAVDLPTRFLIFLEKETTGITYVHNFNVAPTAWKEGFRVNDRKYYETRILLRQPVYLEEKIVYKLARGDMINNAQCFKAQLAEDAVTTALGPVRISLHCENIWCVTSMLFV